MFYRTENDAKQSSQKHVHKKIPEFSFHGNNQINTYFTIRMLLHEIRTTSDLFCFQLGRNQDNLKNHRGEKLIWQHMPIMYYFHSCHNIKHKAMYCSIYSHCYAMIVRQAVISDPLLGNGSVNTFPQQELHMQWGEL
jgi:hypothetical protein